MAGDDSPEARLAGEEMRGERRADWDAPIFFRRGDPPPARAIKRGLSGEGGGGVPVASAVVAARVASTDDGAAGGFGGAERFGSGTTTQAAGLGEGVRWRTAAAAEGGDGVAGVRPTGDGEAGRTALGARADTVEFVGASSAVSGTCETANDTS